MKVPEFTREIVRRLDLYSPWPRFYPFVMTDDEKKVFLSKVKNATNYLEFGFGGSTIFALKNSTTKIFTVESCSEWIDCMRKYFLVKYCEDKRLVIRYVDIGPTGDWGYPKTDVSKKLFPDYSSGIFKTIDGGTIDLALVDGRFRVACTLKLILECSSNTNFEILIHDFWNREKYHVVLKYLDVIDRIDTLGVFSIKKDVDLQSVSSDWNKYKFTPD